MPAFGLVVNDRNEILLIQRGYGRSKGKWSLPGGQRDKGESSRETAVRETYEETGIRMSAESLYLKGKQHHFEVWRGKRISGHLRVQRKECLDAKWFQKDMLPHDENLAFGPDMRAIEKWAAENLGSRRVHYPQSRMRRTGFAIIVNDWNEVLLIHRRRGARKAKWSLPGGYAARGQCRRDAAIKQTHTALGIKFDPERLYYENRHQAQIWLGRLRSPLPKLADARWFSTDKLPDDSCLAFAIDVRTIDKWAADNNVSCRICYS